MAAVARRRTYRIYQEVPIGDKDGVNKTFFTQMKFYRDLTQREALSINGVVKEEGPTANYTITESGGPGTGYDQLNLLYPLHSKDSLRIDYAPVV